MSDGENQITEDRAEVVRALPFVGETPSGVSYWTAEECGHQSTDIDRGAHFATLCIETARSWDMPELVAFVMRDMVKGGRFTALEAGFLGAVAQAARAGRMN